MTLRVYSTLTKSKEDFQPVSPGQVGVYLCGPTVYKPSHIGHMVGPVIFDCIKRFLRHCGYQVTMVVNITDVDDKLIAEANRRGISMQAVAEEMTADYFANLAAMGVDTIDHFPKATENMDEILRFIQELIDRGFAYPADGDVFFDVAKDAEYGKLSGRSVDQMQGEGGGAADRKRSPFDFALWKGAKPGEPSWPSPWGAGRPGWHIECSAMSRRILGKTFDIHGGGLDLVFPHHENEVAQSECCHGQPQAKYWMHNGLVQASGESGKVGGRQARPVEGDQAAQEAGKLGKSKGASAFRDLLQAFPAETIRFFILSTHYRRPIDFSPERITEVGTGLEAYYRYFQRYERIAGESFYQLATPNRREEGEVSPGDDPLLKTVREHREAFLTAMDDDFNTGGAIGILFDFLKTLNRFIDGEKLEEPAARNPKQLESLRRATIVFRELNSILGMFRCPIERSATADDVLRGSLLELQIEIRKEARTAKNYAVGDSIRKTLSELGVTLEDRPAGTVWTLAPTIPAELDDRLIRLLVELRQSARTAKNFPLGDKIRDRLSALGITLEDRGSETDWKRK